MGGERSMSKRAWHLAIMCLAVAGASYAQAGYVVVATADAPTPIPVITPATPLTIVPMREDVRSLGRGSAMTALGSASDPLQANPALLGMGMDRVEIFGLSAGIPPSTVGALGFISDHLGDFENGDFLVLIQEGFEEYRTGMTPAARQAGLDKMRKGLDFPGAVMRDVTGMPGSLRTHGVGVSPYASVALGSWGVSVHNTLQLGFQVSPGTTIEGLSKIHLPEVPALVGASVLLQLARSLGESFDIAGNVRAEALPRAFAVSTNDLVVTAGRSLPVGDRLRLGASVRIVNRRFSSKLIDPENMSSVLSEVRQEFSGSRTGVTGDLGATYRAPFGTTFGVALQNILPMTTLASTAQLNYRVAQTFYLNGSAQPTLNKNEALVGYYNKRTDTFTPNAAGDTLLFALGVTLDVRLPFELKAPSIATIGAAHPISDRWDVMFDIVDVAGNLEGVEGLGPRLRLGTEVRLWSGWVAVRAGLVNDHLSAGAGVDLGPVGIDGATAVDTFTKARAWYAQMRVGW